MVSKVWESYFGLCDGDEWGVTSLEITAVGDFPWIRRMSSFASNFISVLTYKNWGRQLRAWKGKIQVVGIRFSYGLTKGRIDFFQPLSPIFGRLHTDNVGRLNGNTPSHRIRISSTTGPMNRPNYGSSFFQQPAKNYAMTIWGCGPFRNASLYKKRDNRKYQLHRHREYRSSFPVRSLRAARVTVCRQNRVFSAWIN